MKTKNVNGLVEKYVFPLLKNKKFSDNLVNLYYRWQDEKDYEPWAGYEAVLKRSVPQGCKFVRSTKRPMGIVFTLPTTSTDVHVFAKISGGYVKIVAKNA